MRSAAFACLSLLFVLGAVSVEARTWVNTQGKKVQAHYLTSDEETITLVLAKDGREVVVKKAQFSPEDLKYVEEQEVLLTVPAYEEGAKEGGKKSSSQWQRGI